MGRGSGTCFDDERLHSEAACATAREQLRPGKTVDRVRDCQGLSSASSATDTPDTDFETDVMGGGGANGASALA